MKLTTLLILQSPYDEGFLSGFKAEYALEVCKAIGEEIGMKELNNRPDCLTVVEPKVGIYTGGLTTVRLLLDEVEVKTGQEGELDYHGLWFLVRRLEEVAVKTVKLAASAMCCKNPKINVQVTVRPDVHFSMKASEHPKNQTPTLGLFKGKTIVVECSDEAVDSPAGDGDSGCA